MLPMSNGFCGELAPGLCEVVLNSSNALARAKADFLANISHEVRTPLTAILGFTELLEHALPPEAGPECRDHLRAVKRNGEILLGLVSDVLELSRIESGEAEIAIGPCDFLQLIHELKTQKQAEAEAKGLYFKLEMSEIRPLPAIILTDAPRLRHILAHLVGNAFKFTETGGVRLRISVDEPNLAFNSPSLRFEVIDTGIGLTALERSRLFQPFSRADSSRKPSKPGAGTGVGLAICMKLAEQLQGTLEAQGIPAKGSVFTLTIPATAIREVGTAPRPIASKQVEADDTSPRYSPTRLKTRILVAEDNRDNQRVIALRLNLAGAEVTLAPNGREAVNAAIAGRDEGRPFSLVIMDMQMPILDGYGATRTLRDEGFDTLPIVALTAHALPEDREECLRFGCDEYVTKPIQWELLLKLLADLLNRADEAALSSTDG